MQHQEHATAYAKWLDAICQRPIPPDAVAFCVNLYDSSGAGSWDAELIGSPTFDPLNEDWACDDIFNSGPRDRFELPTSVVGGGWEAAMQLFADWTRSFCADPANHGDVLRQSRAVAVGFVEGSLTRVWPPESAA